MAELETGQWAVLDASSPNDLDVIAEQVLAELAKGRKHLCQSAASLLNGLSGMPSVLLEPAELPPIAAPGLVLVGSHVPLSDAQLADLLEQPGCCGVEFSLDEPQEPAALTAQLQQLLSSWRHARAVQQPRRTAWLQPSAATGVGSADGPGGDGP